MAFDPSSARPIGDGKEGGRDAFDPSTANLVDGKTEKAAPPEVSDFGNALQVGYGQAAQGVGYLMKKVGADKLGQSVQDFWTDYAKEQQGQFSEGAKQALNKDMSFSDLGGSLTKAALIGAESVPGMVMTAPVGGAVGAGIKGAAALMAARGIGGALTATAAGAASPLTIGAKIAAQAPGAIGAGVAEGVQAGATNAAQAEQQVMDTPLDKLKTAPGWADALKQSGGDEKKAQQILAGKVGDYNFARSMAATGILGAVTGGGVMGQMLNRELGTVAKKGILKTVLSDAAHEAVQEAPQNASDQLIQNLGEQKYLDPTQSTWQGVGQQAIEGAIVGGLMGGVTGGADATMHRLHGKDKAEDIQPKEPSLAAGDGPDVSVSFPEGGPPADAAGNAPAAPPPAAPPPAADTAARLEQLDAIAQQRDLTPDEAAEVNGLLGGQEQGTAAAEGDATDLTPNSDLALMGMQPEQQQNNTAAQPAAPAAPPTAAQPAAPAAEPVQSDLQAIAAQDNPPPPPKLATVDNVRDVPTIKGAATTFSTDNGAKLDGQYALVDAAHLVTSHDEDLRTNDAFPQELQPRNRENAASRMQVSNIVQRFDPARLGLSADAATGSPIIGADGIVESGNARTIALKRIYSAKGQKAEDYRDFLRNNAASFGLNPADVDNLQQPVLVRVRQSNVDRAEFARQANGAPIAQMSPSELAKSDAQRMTSLDGLQPDDGGDFTNMASRDFIRGFMSKLPVTEQAGMVDANGNLSTAGYARVRNAVLAKAYGDSPTLQRMTESLDDNLRNVSRALLRVAPDVAKARSAIASGDLHDADLAPHLLNAVDEFSKLKDQGMPVQAALSQQGMFGEDTHPITRDMLQFLDENIRRPNRIAALVQSYYEHLAAQGHPAQESLLGPAEPPAVGDLLGAARQESQGAHDVQSNQQSIIGTEQQPRPAGRDQETRPADGAKREGAQGHARRAQGDGVATGAEAAQRVTKKKGSVAKIKADKEKAKADFVDAMADLARIASKHTRAAMIPEETPELMPALVRLFDAAIRIVGSDMKLALKYVKDQLRANPGTKKLANFIKPETYQKAALQALEQQGAGDMLDQADTQPEGALQFDKTPPPKDKQVPSAWANSAVVDYYRALTSKSGEIAIDGETFPLDAQDFGRPFPRTLPDDSPLLRETYSKDRHDAVAQSTVEFDGVRVTRAEMWAAIIDRFLSGKDQPPSGRKPIAYVMGGGGASGKGTIKAKLMKQGLIDGANAVDIDADEIKLQIPEYAKIWEQGDSRGAAVVHEESSMLSKQVRQQAFDRKLDVILDVTLGNPKKGVQELQRLKDMGYEVRLFGVNIEPETAVKRAVSRGFSTGRFVPISALLEAHKGFAQGWESYWPMADDARLYDTTDGVMNVAETQNGELVVKHTKAYNRFAERSGINEQSRTYREVGAYRGRTAGSGGQAEPIQRGTPPDSRVGEPSRTAAGRDQQEGNQRAPERSGVSGQIGGHAADQGTGGLSDLLPGASGDLFGGTNVDVQHSAAGAQGQGALDFSQPAGQQETAPVRAGSDRAGEQRGGADDPGGQQAQRVGQAGSDGSGTQAQSRGRAKPGDRAARPGGIPAGRDIPAKSGRNYRFTPDDLTYTGSWAKKAEQNLAALELLRDLEKSGKQATPEQQATLAKFIGWGSSEMANNLFGKKLDTAETVLRQYDDAVEGFDKRGGQPLRRMPPGSRYSDPGFYQAFNVLQAANPGLSYYQVNEITREQLDKAAPSSDTKRWLKLRSRLKELLTPEEYAEAARSTQYAHYTSAPVVRSMWRAVERMGFKGGTILEPGAGVGAFPGLMPEAMANNSVYTGIEFDPITGGILKQLFPDERILVESFVDSKLPKNYYDVAIGNPPFSPSKILSDPEYKKLALPLHDYFFAKSLDRVKPGGLLMYVTSHYTMDRLGDKARQYMADRADLVGAIRLPQTAFKKNAGTEVVTDVLLLRKKVPGETFDQAKAWGKSVPIQINGNSYNVNEYFLAHPEMVLGEHADTGSIRAEREYTVTPREGDIEQQFADAVETLPADIYKAERGSAAEAAQVREIDFNPKAKKEGNYYVTDKGVLMQREGGVGMRVDGKTAADVQLLTDYVPLRDALKQAHYDQLNNGDWQSSLGKLRDAYRAFTDKHGPLHQFKTRTVKVKFEDPETGEVSKVDEEQRVFPLLTKLRDDPDYTLVQALENFNDDTGEITPSAFQTQRLLDKPQAATINSPHDALLTTLNDLGHVDIPTIAQRIGMAEGDTIEALGTSIYKDPAAGWVMADEYLSGNVKLKLAEAIEAAKSDRTLERNVQALEAAQPAPKKPSDINMSLGMNWVPTDVYEQFMAERAGTKVTVKYSPASKQWAVSMNGYARTTSEDTLSGSAKRSTADLLEHALTGRPIRVTMTVGSGKDKKTVFDPVETEAANAKLDAMRDAFEKWIWEDANRAERLLQLYNDKFNTTVARSFDGSHLTLPGKSATQDIFDHVKRGAWRIIQTGNTYLAHAVGSGKTYQMVISAMEQKRLGLIKKPMMVVPNHMLQQFASEWQGLYPAARLMVADEHNFTGDNRRRFASRVALSDLDGVIITHSAFKLLDIDPKFKQSMIQDQISYLRAALEEVKEDGKGQGRDPRVKDIERRIENYEQKLEAAMSGDGKDNNVRFDELGVDQLYVDEAHEFRKLDFTTSRQVKGISPDGSARAFDLYMKSRWLEQKNPGRSLIMASGTPVTNTTAELYTVQKFMAEQALIDRGIDSFDDWAAMFGREKTELEANASGKYEPVTRFMRFVNVPELTQMFREFADVLTPDHLAAMLGDKRPRVQGGARKMVITPKTGDYKIFQHDLDARYKASKAWKPSKDEPNNPDPIIAIIGDGRLASIDMRFIEPDFPNNPDSKLNQMIDEVIRIHHDSANMTFLGEKDGKPEPAKGATQMVFSDMGFGAGVAEHRGFNARAWFEKRLRDGGVDMSQVAFMSDYKKSADKLKLFKDMNAGRVRILVGSSKNMGTGVNAQQRLLALHHLDSPWYPADLEQREGRIIRKGNKNPLVQIYAYATKGTYDEQMWGLLASKQYFIDQALSGDPNIREIEDLSNQSQYAIASAMVADDPRVMELAGNKAEAAKLERLYQAHEDQRMRDVMSYNQAERAISHLQTILPKAEAMASKVRDLSGDNFQASAGKVKFTDRTAWSDAILKQFADLAGKVTTGHQVIGQISGFPVTFEGIKTANNYEPAVMLEIPEQYPVVLARSADANQVGMAMRASNAIADLVKAPARLREQIKGHEATMAATDQKRFAKFPLGQQLADKLAAVARLEKELQESTNLPEWRVTLNGSDHVELVNAVDAADAVAKAAVLYRKTAKTSSKDWTAEPTNPDAAPKQEPDAPAMSRSADVAAAYDRRIDDLFNGGEANRLGVRVLDRSDMLDMLGYGDKPVVLAEGKVIAGQENHPEMTAAVWKKVPQWLDNPAAVFESDTVPGRLVFIGPELVAGAPVRIIMSPNVKEGGLDLHLAVNAYDAQGGAPWMRWARDGLLRYVNKEKFPAILAPSGLQLARVEQVARGTKKILTQRNLSGYLKAKEQAPMSRNGNAANAHPMSQDDVSDLVRNMAGNWKNAPDIVVVRDLQDKAVPEAVRNHDAQQRSQGANGEPEGFFYGGKAYVVAGQMHSAADVARVVAHEVLGHAGLRGKFGPDLDAVLDQIVTARRGDVAAKAKEYGLGTSAKDLRMAAEEVLANMAQTQPTLGFVRRAVAAIRTWLREHGVPMQMSDDEIISNFILPARRHIQGGMDGSAPVMLRKQAAPAVRSLADDALAQSEWLTREAKMRGFADVDTMAAENPDVFAKLAAKWRAQNPAAALFSRTAAVGENEKADPDPTKRAQQIIDTPAGTPAPVERLAQTISKAVGLERLANAAYNKGGQLLDMIVPERVKAGVVSDYGVPEAVIDRRSAMAGQQRAKLREAGKLVDKLATLTRAESRVAYAWMNEQDPKLSDALMQDLPAESVAVLRQVRDMIDSMSREAVRLGQLSPEAYEAHKFAYLRRSYRKHMDEMAGSDKAARRRTLSILGDQYKGRGIVLKAGMQQMQAAAPSWWGRMLKDGQADTRLKGEKFIRFEKRAPSGEGTAPLDGIEDKPIGKLQQVAYWPAGEAVPARFKEWSQAGTFQVRDVKGKDVVLWRDFTKQEREQMGEIDEARFAIARTIQGMVHDVEVGRYMEWLANKHSKATPADVDGPIVEASERYRDAFKPGEWVQVPDVKIPGTSVARYGALAGRFLPGPIWNDVRQTVGGQFRPFGNAYSKILSYWKTSKTALSPAVHLNNVMSNFIMADWHDVSAGHVAKSLRILLAAQGEGKGAIGRAGATLGKMGLADREAAREIVNRYADSGGDIGTWATNEIAREQIQPLLAAAEVELQQAGPDAYTGQTGIYAALQHALHLRFPDALQAFKAGKAAGAVATEARSLMGLYQAEDDVFRLAAWLRAKEQGATDADAGKVARRSFLDYRINAPWVQAMRNSAFPFISYTYRSVPMLLDVLGHKPHKMFKLMAFAGAVNALGVLATGGNDDDRKLLPDEKAGDVWGIVPKLIRMPWNDVNGSPVYLDIRRFIPLGDVVDIGEGHAAIPMLPTMYPGGPLATIGELVLNKSMFTGKDIVKETDTPAQQAGKVADYLYKSFAPNVIGLPNTYATTNVINAMSGKTDTFGRQQSVAQAVASSFGVKLGSYPPDVLKQQAIAKYRAQSAEIQLNISKLKRQLVVHGITPEEFRDQVMVEQGKLQKLAQGLKEKIATP